MVHLLFFIEIRKRFCPRQTSRNLVELRSLPVAFRQTAPQGSEVGVYDEQIGHGRDDSSGACTGAGVP